MEFNNRIKLPCVCAHATYVHVYRVSATACRGAMAVCVLCLIGAPSTKRRRLYSPSSSDALKELRVLVRRSGYGSGFLPADPGTIATTEQPHLCIKCFSQVERILKLRSTLFHLENKVSQKISQTAVNRGLQPSTSTAGEASGRSMAR